MKRLLLVLQKYEISSKSQPPLSNASSGSVVAGTAKVRNLKQITTFFVCVFQIWCCCWYCKSTKSQANHNQPAMLDAYPLLLLVLQKYEISSKSQPLTYDNAHVPVVAGTAKVRNLKQITTDVTQTSGTTKLLLVLQKYEISSKSQLNGKTDSTYWRCCWYCKSTKSQANHNSSMEQVVSRLVVAGTAKVRNLKQITTDCPELAER